MNISRKTRLVMTLWIAIIAVPALVFAGWGKGGRHCPAMGKGGAAAMQQMGCMGGVSDLSAEDMVKVKAERDAFFKATEDLRQSVYEKVMELKSVLAKKAADAEKAKAVQKEISALQAELDLKKIDHILQMKQIHPRLGQNCIGRTGCGAGMGMGKGMCMGKGMGMGKGSGMGKGMGRKGCPMKK